MITPYFDNRWEEIASFPDDMFGSLLVGEALDAAESWEIEDVDVIVRVQNRDYQIIEKHFKDPNVAERFCFEMYKQDCTVVCYDNEGMRALNYAMT